MMPPQSGPHHNPLYAVNEIFFSILLGVVDHLRGGEGGRIRSCLFMGKPMRQMETSKREWKEKGRKMDTGPGTPDKEENKTQQG